MAVVLQQRTRLVRAPAAASTTSSRRSSSPGRPGADYVYTFHAWPLIWATLLITGGAIALALFSALFVAVFIVEFAPEWMSNILQPVVRFLASVPSVIYGLIGVVGARPVHR